MKLLLSERRTKGIFGVSLLLCMFLYQFMSGSEAYLSIFTTPPIRYMILVIALLIGYYSEKTDILPMMYFRYGNAYIYIEKRVMVRCLLFACFSTLVCITMIQHDSLQNILLYILYEILLFLLLDTICRILGICMKSKMNGYFAFIIIFALLDIFFLNSKWQMISELLSNILVLPYVYSVQLLFSSMIVLNGLVFVSYVVLIKYTDKMVSIL